MSVYIKGMEMPTCCAECKLCALLPINDYAIFRKCLPLNRRAEIPIRREDCPLIPVPDHGRLIDADALAEYFESQAQSEWNKHTETTWSNAYLSLGGYVEEYAPTIIPEDTEVTTNSTT